MSYEHGHGSRTAKRARALAVGRMSDPSSCWHHDDDTSTIIVVIDIATLAHIIDDRNGTSKQYAAAWRGTLLFGIPSTQHATYLRSCVARSLYGITI